MKPNILMDKYELGRLVGQGTFGKVYHARNLKTGDAVAIKAMDKQKVLKVGMIKQIKREISAMRLVRHPNIVRIYEVMATKSKIYIVMEHLKGGELFSRVSEEGRLEDEEARKYFQQLISAVDFCHSRGVYHRDLKLENLLLDDNGVMKVCDFGLSALPDQIRQDGLLHTACGTPNYVAPEVITKKGYDGAKADIWSCGVILFALLAGYLPFHDANLMALYKKIHSCDFKFPQWFSSDVRQLILRFLDPNPGTRITVAQLKEVPWFQRGFKPPRPDNDPNVGLLDDVDLAFCVPKPARLNAFGIISLSPAFNLSGLFEDKIVKQDLWFTSTHPAWSIISKLEEIARILRFSVKKSDDCKVKLRGSEEGRKGYLSLDAEISEVTPSLFVVELRKTGGDTIEYSKLCSEELRPSLKDIVWVWDGNSPENTV